MARSTIRLVFCLAVAVIAAAIADPIVEFASNAGWFGRSALTDHSNLNVLPTLFVGFAFVALQVVLKVRAALCGGDRSASRDVLRVTSQALSPAGRGLLPAAFALQILVLFLMETGEQFAVWGHDLGGTVWLGGPALASLAVHAAICLIVACVAVRSVHTLAHTTLRVIRLIRALATLPSYGALPTPPRRWKLVTLNQFGPVLCTIGERAPPLLRA